MVRDGRHLKKLETVNLTLHLRRRHGSLVVRDLRVCSLLLSLLDIDEAAHQQCDQYLLLYHVRRLKQVRRIRLWPRDHSQSCCLCVDLTATIYDRPLQWDQNAAAWLITTLRSRDHVTPSLQQLHCRLPVKYHRLCILMQQSISSSWSLPVPICHPDDSVFVPPAPDTMTYHVLLSSSAWPFNLEQLTQRTSGR